MHIHEVPHKYVPKYIPVCPLSVTVCRCPTSTPFSSHYWTCPVLPLPPPPKIHSPALCFVARRPATTDGLTIHLELFLPSSFSHEACGEKVEQRRAARGKQLSSAFFLSVISSPFHSARFQSPHFFPHNLQCYSSRPPGCSADLPIEGSFY